MCIESYVGDNFTHDSWNPCRSEYISPGLVCDKTLKQFPPTRIMVAANDPLRDESLRLVLRMTKLGSNVRLKEYLYMPHGYLNFNAPLLGMKDEANEAIN